MNPLIAGEIAGEIAELLRIESTRMRQRAADAEPATWEHGRLIGRAGGLEDAAGMITRALEGK